MCGICGFFHKQSVNEKVLHEMNQTINYRGPDDEGYYFDACPEGYQLGLAQKRLSIIDLSPLGHQPMKSSDDNIVVIYNGETYNFISIKEELQKLGHFFKSDCDTEVIIYAYKEWGIDFVKRLNGMFAIALYDKKRNELFLIRDRMGVKPLYYYYNGQDIVFASELKPIVKYPFFSKQIDFDSLNMYLYHNYITAPYTIFEKTYKLNPGCYIIFRNGIIEEHKYWDIENILSKRSFSEQLSENDYETELEKLISDSVRLRMISDVPLGAFLSGGIDSSLITAFMQKASNKPIKTFTIGFQEERYDEAPFAKEVAQYLGTEHYEEYLPISKALELIDDIPLYFDEPMGDDSILPTMLVSSFAKKHVTVSLSGDAGDELFCGYNTYDYLLKLNKLKAVSKAFKAVNSVIPVDRVAAQFSRKALVLRNSDCDNNIINFPFSYDSYYLKGVTERTYDINAKFYPRENFKGNIQEKRMLVDMVTFLPDDILTKVDRASMAVSLEARTPLLDYRIVEFALNCPHELKYRQGIKKYLLKKILYKHIPEHILDRPKKGFGIPVQQWLHTSLKGHVQKYLGKSYIEKQGIFDYEVISLLLKRFELEKDKYFSDKVWTILMFQMWYDKYIINM